MAVGDCTTVAPRSCRPASRSPAPGQGVGCGACVCVGGGGGAGAGQGRCPRQQLLRARLRPTQKRRLRSPAPGCRAGGRHAARPPGRPQTCRTCALCPSTRSAPRSGRSPAGRGGRRARVWVEVQAGCGGRVDKGRGNPACPAQAQLPTPPTLHRNPQPPHHPAHAPTAGQRTWNGSLRMMSCSVESTFGTGTWRTVRKTTTCVCAGGVQACGLVCWYGCAGCGGGRVEGGRRGRQLTSCKAGTLRRS